MSDAPDARVEEADRRGSTGPAGADRYRPILDAEQITLPPDGRPMDEQPAWRTDFPVDWPQDHYVERRDFMKFLVLTSFAFAVGQVSIGVRNWWRRRTGRPPLKRVASIDEIRPGSALAFWYPTPQDPCVLIRSEDDLFVAYSQRCTHLSCAVLPQPAARLLRCPCHEGYFDLASGRPIAGPPRRPLARIRLERRGRLLFAAGVEERTA